MKETLSRILFSAKAELKNIDPSIKVGAMISGAPTSPARGSRAVSGVKINSSALFLDHLRGEKANARYSKSSDIVYCEYITGGVRYHASFDGNVMKFKEKAPEGIALVYPFAAYIIATNKGYAETKEAFDQAKHSSDVNKIAYFCDNFYYQTKDMFEIEITEENSMELIAQAIRTGEMDEIECFKDLKNLLKFDLVSEIPENEKKEKESQKDKLFESAKAGLNILDYLWDVDRRNYIPSLKSLDSFVPSTAFFTAEVLMKRTLNRVLDRLGDFVTGIEAIGDDYLNFQLVGKPGTGKTTFANALAADFGLPIRVVTVSKNTEEDTFQGMTKVMDGGYQFVETPFLDAYKNGGIILLEEFNLADPGVMMGALGQALEKPFILLEDGYKEVRRHPLCVVIATMNVGTQGSREPSEAFTSRAPHVFMLDDPETEQFISILEKKSGQPKKTCKKVYKAYQKVLEYLMNPRVNAEDVALSITLRHCLAALIHLEIGESFSEAIKNTMVGTIAVKDLSLAKDVYNSVVATMAD